MERNELKGRQTPGTAMMDDGPFVYLLNDIQSNRAYAQVQPGWECVGFRTSKEECHANAALYAEAHNVANDTGMWPRDLVERVKELEETLESMISSATDTGGTIAEYCTMPCESLRERMSHANQRMTKRIQAVRAILNKKS